MTIRRTLGALVILFVAAAGKLPAQEAGGAFDSVHIVLRGVADMGRNEFHRFWDPAPGAELGIEIPFYLGRVEAGVQVMSFTARSDPQPDFLSTFGFVGWGFESKLPANVGGYAGLRIGSFLTRFDAEGVARETRTEQEIGWAAHAHLRRSFAGAWYVEVSGRYRVVLTRRRIRLAFLGLGIGRSFASPGWLKEFLR